MTEQKKVLIIKPINREVVLLSDRYGKPLIVGAVKIGFDPNRISR